MSRFSFIVFDEFKSAFKMMLTLIRNNEIIVISLMVITMMVLMTMMVMMMMVMMMAMARLQSITGI